MVSKGRILFLKYRKRARPYHFSSKIELLRLALPTGTFIYASGSRNNGRNIRTPETSGTAGASISQLRSIRGPAAPRGTTISSKGNGGLAPEFVTVLLVISPDKANKRCLIAHRRTLAVRLDPCTELGAKRLVISTRAFGAQRCHCRVGDLTSRPTRGKADPRSP